MEDQYEKKRLEKKERISKNQRQQLRNMEANQSSNNKDDRALQRAALEQSIAISKVSTASLGKFDKKLEKDGLVKLRKEKRHFEPVAMDVGKERDVASSIAKKVISSGGVLRIDKAVNKRQQESFEERPKKSKKSRKERWKS